MKSLSTHLFNGMMPLSHKNPGPVAAFLNNDNTYVELITDGVHVHPSVLELVIKLKGVDKTLIVTDAVSPAGTETREFDFFGHKLYVKNNSCYLNEDTLAGSALTMNTAAKIVSEKTSFPITDIISMSSHSQALLLGIESNKGSLEIGFDADIVIMNENYEISANFISGEQLIQF